MLKWRGLAAFLVASLIALTPILAAARAGGSYGSGGGSSFSSMGSRGSQTYSNNGGQPMQRSLTPQPSPTSPYGAQPGYGGYGAGHPFLGGLAGGFLGGWLGSMLFPHWGMGHGGGFGGVLGSLFSWLVIIGVVYMGYRLFTRGVRTAGGPGFAPMNYGAAPQRLGLGYGGGASSGRAAPLAIAAADYQAFEDVLKHVQGSWTQGDLAQLRHYVTPEMLSYFAEELAGNESQGVTNHVEQVELLRGDLREAWDEGALQYATCYMRWRALDYTVRGDRRAGDPGYLANGDLQRPTEAAELWTFARGPGGHWLLSAIQQV